MNWNEWIISGKAALQGALSDPAAIATGFYNNLLAGLDALDPKLADIAQARANICRSCPIRRDDLCAAYHTIYREGTKCKVHGCGCKLAAKTKTPWACCPAHKWPPVQEGTWEPLPYPPDPAHNRCQ